MISVKERQTASGHSIGLLRLNAPQSLNALTLDMVLDAYEQLQHWADQRADIVCVILSGEGRSFCAGGDVRRMRQGIQAGDDYCARFFEAEYKLDQLIHSYAKPIVVLGHGPVMGGGLGLFIGASHRVAADNCQFAMPELSIGLYPDVGASHFLNKLPAGVGELLAVTGAKWNAADALAWGMADVVIDDSRFGEIDDLLANADWTGSQSDHQLASQLLQTMASSAPSPLLSQHTAQFAALAGLPLVQLEVALTALPILDEGYAQAMTTMRAGNPVSKAIAVEQLARGKRMSIEQALAMEWGVSMACCERPDFPEGVRAQLVDKDKSPKWQFSTAAEVPDDYVQAHFAPRDDVPDFQWR